MKFGVGLYRHMLTTDNFRFAKQAGATDLVAHFVDYFKEGPRIPGASSHGSGWGVSDNRGRLWTVEELCDLRAAINAEGLELAAIENFDPSHWYDILLDGPRKQEQLEDVKELIRRLGKAGIPCMGYNFSVAGGGDTSWGRSPEGAPSRWHSLGRMARRKRRSRAAWYGTWSTIRRRRKGRRGR